MMGCIKNEFIDNFYYIFSLEYRAITFVRILKIMNFKCSWIPFDVMFCWRAAFSVSLHQFLQPPNSPSTHPYHFFTFKSSYYILVKLNPIFFLLKVPAGIGCHTAVLFYFTMAHALFNKNLKWNLYILSSSGVIQWFSKYGLWSATSSSPCLECRFSASRQTYWIRSSRGWAQQSVF